MRKSEFPPFLKQAAQTLTPAAVAGEGDEAGEEGMGKRKRFMQFEKPWCYYCDREFEEMSGLIDHQKAKHFKCPFCSLILISARDMVSHAAEAHKESITKVPNAKPDRDSTELEIRGMRGIPESFLAAKRGQGEAPSDVVTGGEVPGSSEAYEFYHPSAYDVVPPMYSPAPGWPLPAHAPYPWYSPAPGRPLPAHAPYPWYSPAPGRPLPAHAPYPWYSPAPGRPLPAHAPYPWYSPASGWPLPVGTSARYPGYSFGPPGLSYAPPTASVSGPLFTNVGVNANSPTHSVLSTPTSASSSVLASSLTNLKDKADVAVNDAAGPSVNSPATADNNPASQLAIVEVYLLWDDEAMSMEERRLSLPKYQVNDETINSNNAAMESKK